LWLCLLFAQDFQYLVKLPFSASLTQGLGQKANFQTRKECFYWSE